MTAIIWLIIMAVLIVIELATLGLTTIWFAAGALAACIAAVLDPGSAVYCRIFSAADQHTAAGDALP